MNRKRIKKWDGVRKGIEPFKKPADLIYQILSHHSPYRFSEYYLVVIHLESQNLTIVNTTCIMSKFFIAS